MPLNKVQKLTESELTAFLLVQVEKSGCGHISMYIGCTLNNLKPSSLDILALSGYQRSKYTQQLDGSER